MGKRTATQLKEHSLKDHFVGLLRVIDIHDS